MARTIDLSGLGGTRGFVIQGDAANDYAGWSVSNAGDVNGDGIDDLIVGAPGGNDGGANAGEAYVIFGKAGATRPRIDLASLAAADGYIIQGSSGSELGSSVSAAGDVNGDGIDDLIIGAPQGGGTSSGATFVIYGTAATRGVVDVASLSSADGFSILGDQADDQAGFNVSGAGDVNGDGIDDLIVGAPYGDNGGQNAGEAYVIFGRAGTRGTLDLTDLPPPPTTAFIIQGDAAGNQAGFSVSSAGDVNGDGIDDLIVGAPFFRSSALDVGDRGAAYVVFGKAGATRGSIDLTNLLAEDGFVLLGKVGAPDMSGDMAGYSVAAAGDINGDGIGDLIVGAPFSDKLDPTNIKPTILASDAGKAYVIFGTAGATRANIDLTSLTAADGFIIQGDAANDQVGFSVSTAGDVNGDGIDDLLVGAPFGDKGGTNAGETYLVFGKAGATRPDIDLANLAGADGLIIQGDASSDQAGRSVSAAGDINGDGIDDLIVGAPRGDDGGSKAGEAYVIFGSQALSQGPVATDDEFVGFRNATSTFTVTQLLRNDDSYFPFDLTAVSNASNGSVTLNANGTISFTPTTGFIGKAGFDYTISDGGLTGVGRVTIKVVQAAAAPVIDLTGLAAASGFTVRGRLAGDQAGSSVSLVGDLNGDGIDDLIVGAPRGDIGGTDAGEAYVIFGQAGATRADINLGALRALTGFTIRGESTGDQAGFSVTFAGDVNGDGLGDLIVGAPYNGVANGGEAYVIFGVAGAARTDIDLTGIAGTSNGFAIKGKAGGDLAGHSVSAAGDINGDGIDDLIVGAPRGDDGGTNAGEAYVVFGVVGATRTNIDLANLAAADGFIIKGDAGYDYAGFSVSAAGDVNGDGIDDLIVGAPNGDDGGSNAGEAYVIFGMAGERSPIDVSALGSTDGFIIKGEAAGDEAGFRATGAGDINGDGIDDLIVGAPYVGGQDAGRAYVIYGEAGATRGDITLSSNLAAKDGFSILGDLGGDKAGLSVSAAGDVDGDGIGDLIVGAPGGNKGGADAGQAYVILGKVGATRGTIDLTGFGAADGFIIKGDAAGDQAGFSVSGGGDVNNDGVADLVVGAPRGDDRGSNAGEAYVIFGSRALSLGPVAADDQFVGVQNTSVTLAAVQLLQNDFSPFPVSITSVSNAANGSVNLNADGTVTFTPTAGFLGDAEFTYRVDDGTVTEVGQVTIRFVQPALAPVIDAGGFFIRGGAAGDEAGFSVSGVGDVNGDGIADLIVGAPYNDAGGGDAGEAYVIFGKSGATRANVNLATISGTNGFKIQGDAAGDEAGSSVSNAGDINGDGIEDLIVGAAFGDDGGTNAGEAYVIFGKSGATRANIDLSNLTAANGFIIQGDASGDRAGHSVSAAGDVNGDGIDDLIVGAPRGDDGGTNAGEAYVVFGTVGATRTSIDLTNLAAADGFIIKGDTGGDYAGYSVSAAGDVNGDGIDDLVIGAPYNAALGKAYVVFGIVGATRTDIDLTNLMSADGFHIQGDAPQDQAGFSVSAAGDINGDGVDDLIVGANLGDNGGSNAGEAYVIFGNTNATRNNIDLTGLAAADGFIIRGDAAGDQAGISVSAAGDVNGDGIDDLIVGAPLGDDGGSNAGQAYVIFGKAGATRANIDLTGLSAADGVIIQGNAAADQAGFSVSAAGDVNDDGFDDLIVGARRNDLGGTDAGEAYVVFGRANFLPDRAPIVSAPIPDQSSPEDAPWSYTVPAGTFADPDGDPLTYTATRGDNSALPDWLTFDPVTRTFSGMPPLNVNGGLSLKVVATANGKAVGDGFTLTVTPTPDNPVVNIPIADQISAEDAAWSFALPVGTFFDVDGDALTYSAALADDSALPAWLAFDAATQTFSGTPPQDFNGALDLKVTATAIDGAASDVFSLTVTPVADAPVVSAPIADQSSPEDAPWSFTVPVGTFVDPDGDALTYGATLADDSALPAWLAFDPATQTFSGTPPQDFNGALDLKVTASASDGAASDVFTLTVTPVPDAPVVSAPIADQTSTEDAAWSFALPAGTFFDVDGDALTYSAALADDSALPAWLVFDAATQTFSGTPPQDFNGALDLKVIATAGDGSASDVFTLTVTPVADAPVVNAPIADQASPEDAPWSFTLPAGTFADADGDALTYAATLADDSALPAWLAFDGATQTFSGTPPQDFNGSLDLKVTATASDGAASDVFTLTVTPVADAPVVSAPIPDQISAEDAPWIFILPAGTFTDTDGDALAYSATLADDSTLPAWLAFDAATRTFSGTPPQDFNGTLDLKVTATASDGAVSDVFALTVTPVADAPVLSVSIADQASPEDAPWSFTLPAGTFTDADGDTLSYGATLADDSALPAWLAFDAATQTFSGTPPQDFNGTLDLKVTATAGDGSASDVFTLTVTPVGDAPVVNSAIADQTSPEDAPWSFTLPAGTFFDVDGDALTITATQSNDTPLPAWLSFNAATRTFSGTPPKDFNGALDLKVTATAVDGAASDVFTLTISPVSDSRIYLGTSAGNVFVAPYDPNDRWFVDGRDGADRLTTSDGDDSIIGGGGGDIINAGGGNDTIIGGWGNDTINAGSGDDVIAFDIAGATSDLNLIDGGAGFDELRALIDNATIGLSGLSGVERIDGGGFANVVINLTSANDVLDLSGVELIGIASIKGGNGSDTIIGSAGNDTIMGEAGNDVLSGGLGDDLFLVSGVSTLDSFDGGIGFDTIRATAANAQIGATTFTGIEVIDGGGFAGVSLVGTAAADTIDLSAVALIGIASIRGGNGNDTIIGSAGNDTIMGEAGNDVLSGGLGDDLFLVSGVSTLDSFDGGIGFDTIRATAANAQIGATTFTSVEVIDGGGFAGVSLVGTNAVDTIDLSAVALIGIASIKGGNGNDTIIGSAGNDTILGEAGNDVLSGGLGDDLFLVSGVSTLDSFDGGIGFDTIRATAANAQIGATTFTGIEVIDGGGFAGVSLVGTAAADTIDLSGVVLTGVALIDGGAGADTIIGAAGGNRLKGGAGADTLTGGLGADVFDYDAFTESSAAGADTITDFVAGLDRIDLNTIDANTGASGNQDFSFIGAAAFSKTAGEVRLDTSIAGFTTVQADINGDGKSDIVIQLQGQPQLTVTDFLL